MVVRIRQFQGLREWLVKKPKEEEVPPEEILSLIEQARKEWFCAHSYFSHATHPDLVDHAIYSIEAAERKYMYLLKQARFLGIQPEVPLVKDYWPSVD